MLITDNTSEFGVLKADLMDGEFYTFDPDTGTYELFSETSESSKDLELMGAKVEENKAEELGEKFAAEYGLSEERGQKVAKTMAVYNKLITKRALTPSEKDQFSNILLGVNYKAAEKGLKSGDADDFDALMEKAAETNGSTPEQMSAIIKDMVL